MSTAQAVAEWALSLSLGDVPDGARDSAKRHLLDGLGCAIAASRRREVDYALAAARSLGAADEATVIGTAERLSAPAAALANGALVHALDYDDTHAGALVHATAAVLPAAFAVGEQTRSSGAEVLAAAIAGYETVIRLGAAVPHGFHERGFHATSVCGVFASALVAAKLMRLTHGQAVNALGIAGSMASGSLEFLVTGSSTKQLHPGLSGMAGILAARLASNGAQGPSSIIEGEHGLYRLFTSQAPDPRSVVESLGDRWEVTRITIKPYPACQLSHASLDALRALLPKLGDLAAIDRVTFAVPKGSVPIVCEPAEEKRRPRTPYEGRFSLPYCAAALTVDGALDVDSFEPARLGRRDVLDLAGRIGYTATAFSPPAEAPGEVVVTLTNGESLHASVPSSRGGPEAPLSDDEVLAKFAANCGGHTPDALVRSVRDLDRLHDIGAVLEGTAP